jgi:hypothetical protein
MLPPVGGSTSDCSSLRDSWLTGGLRGGCLSLCGQRLGDPQSRAGLRTQRSEECRPKRCRWGANTRKEGRNERRKRETKEPRSIANFDRIVEGAGGVLKWWAEQRLLG